MLSKNNYFICIFLILMISFLGDSVPRFYLGDSESYLLTNIHIYIPEDRSWSYGLIVSTLIATFKDLTIVSSLQIFALFFSAYILARLLIIKNRSNWVALLIFMLAFLNPIDFYWSRAFMTDSLSSSIFIICIAIIYNMDGYKLLKAITLIIFFVTLISLRSIYAPPLMAASFFVAIIYIFLLNGNYKNSISKKYFIIFLSIFLSYNLYSYVNRVLLEQSYNSANYAAPRFLVGAWSPLLQLIPPESIYLKSSEIQKLPPFTRENRTEQLFSQNGISELLSQHFGGYKQAKFAYDDIIKFLIFNHPVEVLKLVLHSWKEYLTPSKVLLYHNEMRNTGTTTYFQPNVLSGPMINWLKNAGIWQELRPELPQSKSLGLRYYSSLGGYWALLLAYFATFSIPLIFLLPKKLISPEIIFFNIFSFLYMAFISITSIDLMSRYLMPITPPLLIWLHALLTHLSEYLQEKI